MMRTTKSDLVSPSLVHDHFLRDRTIKKFSSWKLINKVFSRSLWFCVLVCVASSVNFQPSFCNLLQHVQSFLICLKPSNCNYSPSLNFINRIGLPLPSVGLIPVKTLKRLAMLLQFGLHIFKVAKSENDKNLSLLQLNHLWALSHR